MRNLMARIGLILTVITAGLATAGAPSQASVPDWDFSPHQLPKIGTHAQARALTGSGFYYAGAFETGISANGLSAKMRVSKPYWQNNGSEHTLMEIALQDHPGGSPDNAVEFGWTVDGSLSAAPRLFTFYWIGGTPMFCYFGCAAWHDNASNPVNIGADLSTDAAACVGTSLACVKTFQIQYRASACGSSASGTFMTYDGTDVGCLDSASLPSTSYTNSLEYGEVYYGGSTVPCTDMGRGKYSDNGPYSSLSPSVIQSVTYLGSATTPNLTLYNTSNVIGYDANAYTNTSNGSTGNRTFSIGGPGYTSTGTSPGNIGSC